MEFGEAVPNQNQQAWFREPYTVKHYVWGAPQEAISQLLLTDHLESLEQMAFTHEIWVGSDKS